MQGGRRDVYLGSDADNSPLDMEYDSVNEITLSRSADTLVQKLRRAWIFLLATPVAWAHGQPHAKAMRRDKLKKVADGTKTVVSCLVAAMVAAVASHPVDHPPSVLSPSLSLSLFPSLS